MGKLYKMLFLLILSVFYIESMGDTMWAGNMDKKSMEKIYSEVYISNTIHSVQVYIAIKKYCKIYNVPEIYAFRVARIESGWKGPIHLNYCASDKISSANAYGAMQVLLSTGQDVWKDKSITKERLLTDVDFNVHTGIKYMRQLYDGQCHSNWPKVFAYYNTGYVELNDYALNVIQ